MEIDPKISTGDKFPLILLEDLPAEEKEIFLDCYSMVNNDCFVLHTVYSELTNEWMCEKLDEFLCNKLNLKPQDSVFIEHRW